MWGDDMRSRRFMKPNLLQVVNIEAARDSHPSPLAPRPSPLLSGAAAPAGTL